MNRRATLSIVLALPLCVVTMGCPTRPCQGSECPDASMGGAAAGADGGISSGKGGAAAGVGGTGTGGSLGGAGGSNQCVDGMKDGAETDVDCGGGTCGKCDVNRACSSDSDCKTGSCSRLFCVLVSGPPNWLAGPSLNYGRGYAVAGTALGSGQWTLFVTGGRDDADSTDPALSNYEVLSSDFPNAWTAYANSPETISATATDAKGDLLLFSFQATWSMSVPHALNMLPTVMPTPRTSVAAASGPQGLAYVIGGVSGSVSGAVEAYDAVMNKWTTGLQAIPTPRYNLAAALGTDGLVYAIGGDTDQGSVGLVEAYDATNDTWSTKSALPAGDDFLAAVSGPDGRIYVLGGLTGIINGYTPATNRWTSVVPLSDGRSGVATAVTPDGHIWAIGGTTNPELTGESTVQVYGPSVTASPQAGVPGTDVMVTGSNFATNANVSVYFNAVSGAPLATGVTDGAGTLGAPITCKVPSLPGGAQRLIVLDDRSQYPITITFQVQ